MSYASFGFYGFGTTASDCGPNSSYNPTDDACLCNAGFEDNPNFLSNPKVGCHPIRMTPCPPGQFRDPLDKVCVCPPGTIENPDPTRSDCISSPSWFPECKDAMGNRIPGCLFGMSQKAVLLSAAGGAAIGIVLCGLLGALRKARG